MSILLLLNTSLVYATNLRVVSCQTEGLQLVYSVLECVHPLWMDDNRPLQLRARTAYVV